MNCQKNSGCISKSNGSALTGITTEPTGDTKTHGMEHQQKTINRPNDETNNATFPTL